ncbi:gamma-glutamyl-gamma-aminobutyrate hydrolase family protein [Streptomyces sp. NPDC006879]|uniref:gamma-glutamyl-gamma-aminobutyrate hydrolase family protein n=1 Tax=Streptomyces sp. NPDC006879 TaxID=3364767 RepID=UPI0036CAC331
MSGPVVALTTDASTVSYGIWGPVPTAILQWNYVQKIVDAGGTPLLLPPVPQAVEDAVDRVDALLMVGGPDVGPELYGAERHPRTLPTDAVRDATEVAVLAAAIRRDIPVLGICRGMQLMSILRGGTLDQHLPEHGPAAPGRFDVRQMKAEPDSKVAAALGTEFELHCHHHQGIDRLGEGLVVTARAADGVIEAIEDPSLRYLVGVQAHPEVADTEPLFRAFVDAAR